MFDPLSVLMIVHHRRHRLRGRSLVMAQHLVKRGHKVTLVATADTRKTGITENRNDGLRIVEIPDFLWGRLRSGWDLWNMLNREYFLRADHEKYDLVHVFETRPNCIYPALSIVNRLKLPFLTDWNDWFGRGGIIEVLRPRWYRNIFGPIETYYEEAFRNRADGVTVISNALGERAYQLGIPREKIRRIPGGAIPELYPARDMDECRAHMGYPHEIPILGFSSSDSHLDMEIIFDTLAILKTRLPGIRLIVTGKVNTKVLAMANKLGVLENLILPGFLPVEELSWCLGSANIFLLPFPATIYNIGRWPNKIGLYMSQGRPTVTNPVGDIKPVIEQSQIGLLAESTPESFAEKTYTLLNDNETCQKMGMNALELALTRFNWTHLIVDLEEFYYQTINQGGRYS